MVPITFFVGLYEQQNGVIYDVTPFLLDQPVSRMPVATKEKPACEEVASENVEAEENKPVTRKELFNILKTLGLTEETQ